MSNTATLAGKTVVIIGGSSGMGLAAATALAARQAKVVVVGRNQDKLDAAARQIGDKARGEVRTAAVDLSDATAARAFFADLDALDHLVIAASSGVAWGPFVELEPEILRTAFDGKFWVHFHAARFAAPRLGPGASITFLTGGAARAALPGTAGLAAVNGAIGAMARTLAKELAPIRVNVLSPGFVDTPAYDGMAEAERTATYQHMAETLPVGRIGATDDIAPAIAFLVENGFTTGAVLDVDGGNTLLG
ncbi:MAG: SDR family oxidoreductase [Myxococcota bacterium]